METSIDKMTSNKSEDNRAALMKNTFTRQVDRLAP